MSTTPVGSYNEWDPLEEVIVGRVEHARMPEVDLSLFAVEFQDEYETPEQVPIQPFPERVIEETAEDLEIFCAKLQELGVTVRRPEAFDHSKPFATPHWESNGFYNYCPRDLFLVLGDLLIETPPPIRARYFETFSFRALLREYFTRGARWISAPKPMLDDETYRTEPDADRCLTEAEPLFDAANVLRMGRDVLYLVSSSGNESGCTWLQRHVGEEYRVWSCADLYSGTHLDTTISLLRPGLVLLNPERVREEALPEPLRGWDKIWCPEMVDPGYIGQEPFTSIWIGMNLLMVSPELAIVEESQAPLIEELRKHKIEAIPLPLRHCRTLHGGFHCVTLDVRRAGSLESYC